MSDNIKEIDADEESTGETDTEDWYTDIGTEEEKELIEESEPYFFIN